MIWPIAATRHPIVLRKRRSCSATSTKPKRKSGQAETSRRAAAQVRQDARANWQNACAPLGLIAPTLSDVILLLDARERVIDARRDLTLAQGEQAALQHRHAEWTARLDGGTRSE